MAGKTNKEKEQESQEQEQSQDANDGGEQSGSGQEERTFTQAEIDAAVKDRLKRERDKYTDYSDLKAKAEKYDTLAAEQMSELEKAQKRADDAEAAKDAALKQAQETLVKSAFVAEAAKLGAVHPGDAYALADRSGVEIAEDGSVNGVEDAVKALVEGGRLPVGKQRAPSLDGGAGDGDRSNEVPLTADELAAARKMGLTPEQYQKGKKTKEQ